MARPYRRSARTGSRPSTCPATTRRSTIWSPSRCRFVEPAPSGFPCATKGCTIVTGFRATTLAVGSDAPLGGSAFAIERFNGDGMLDPTFSGDGKVRTPFEAGQASASGLAVLPDGRFVVAGDIDIGGSQGELVALRATTPTGRWTRRSAATAR